MKWGDLLLALASTSSPLAAILGFILYYRQNKQKKDLDLLRDKGLIQIDESTHNKLVLEAATINQQREQEREAWWVGQISTLRVEIEAERRLSHRRFLRLNQLEDWATLHVSWDRKAWNKLLEIDPEFAPPPLLPEEIISEVRERRSDVEL
jgi:hypothetical protein